MGLLDTIGQGTADLARGQRGYAQTTAQREREAQAEDIRAKIEEMPEYEIPEEVYQQLDLLKETSKGMVSQAEEATGVARARAGMMEAPGTARGKADIRASQASQVQAARQIGGAGALGAISDIQRGAEDAYSNLIQANLMQKDKAESELMGALSTEAGIRSQATGLEAQGLGVMAQERQKKFQSDLSKYSTGLQFDIGNLAVEQQVLASDRNRKKFLGIF